MGARGNYLIIVTCFVATTGLLFGCSGPTKAHPSSIPERSGAAAVGVVNSGQGEGVQIPSMTQELNGKRDESVPPAKQVLPLVPAPLGVTSVSLGVRRRFARRLFRKIDSADDEKKLRECRRAIRYKGPAESCDAQLLGNGSLVLIYFVIDCGDSCETEDWVIKAGAPPVKLGFDSGTVESDPTGSYLVYDDLTDGYVDGEYRWVLELHWFELASRTSGVFARCFSLKLSPSGKTFSCRNKDGDLLRVPLRGGAATTVAKAGSPGPVVWVPASWQYPSPVTFIEDGRVEFRVIYNIPQRWDTAELVKTVKWIEPEGSP